MSDQQRIDRGQYAKRALEEFLDPAFVVVTEEYDARLKAACAARPWATNEIAALANASRIVAEVRQQIYGLVMDGEAATANLKRAEKVAALSPAKQRLFNIGVPR